MDKVEKLLKELTEANGVSGYEEEISNIIKKHYKPIGQIMRDKLGSIVCKKSGGADEPRVALAAHMDEIGFMTKYITNEGFIRFTPLGGWFDQVLLGQKVIIKTNKGDIAGVIGAKPPHVLSDEERKKMVEKKDMYIDIGSTSQKEVTKAGVRIGDPIVPVSQFLILTNPKTYMSKAFDDRAGCGVSIEVMQELAKTTHPNTVYAVATVQEEVGPRGAATSVELVNPDVAIILEVDIAGDVPGIKPEETAVKLNAGPVLLALDARMIPNLKLRDLVIDIAAKMKIPLQLSAMDKGGTDGAQIHLHKTGVPTVVLCVPTRHIHSHNAIIHRDDFDKTVKLATAIVKMLDKKTVASLTAW